MKREYYEKVNNHLTFTPLFFTDLLSQHLNKNIKTHTATLLTLPKNAEISQVKHPDNLDHPIGVFKYRLQIEIDNKLKTEDVVVKSKVSDINYLKNISHLFQHQLGVNPEQPLENYLKELNFLNINKREIITYQLQKQYPILSKVMPRLLGCDDDPQNNSSVLILKAFDDNYSANNHVDYQLWNSDAIHAVIDAIGTFHHCWYNHLTHLPQGQIINYVNYETYSKLKPLWNAIITALGNHINHLITIEDHELFKKWADTTHEWYPMIDSANKTIIHNDFAPKNIAIKFQKPSHAIVLDWELPTIHLPQRDIIEFLAYVLPESHEPSTLFHFLKRHMLIVHKDHDENSWLKQTKSALLDYLLQRLSLCILIEKVEPRDIKRVFSTAKKMLTHINHYLGEKQ